MKRPVIFALAASAALLGAGAAHAGNVHWSVGVNLPPVATVISITTTQRSRSLSLTKKSASSAYPQDR